MPDGPLREVVHSPLRRTTQTAEAIVEQLRIVAAPAARPGLLEIGQGEWEGLHRDEVAARYGDILAPGDARRPTAWAPAASRWRRSRHGSDRHSPDAGDTR
jgi:broad specificity phosphatase PhoE